MGDPGQRIVEAAVDVDCIVMATHGRTGPERTTLGSVADHVVRHAPAPVLLVPRHLPASSPAITGVVVPLDGSKRAEAALPGAIALARHFEVPFAVVRVSAGSDPDAERYLDAVVRRHETTNSMDARLRMGEVVPELLASAGTTDLVVMTTRGHHGLRRYLLGSVADALIRGAKFPILLCRASSSAWDGFAVRE